MEPSTPTGFGVRLLDVDADALDAWLVGLFDDELGFRGNLAVPETEFAGESALPSKAPFNRLPAPY